MKTINKPDVRTPSDKKLDYKNKALMIVFAVMIILCITFTVGALYVTVQFAEFSQSGWGSGISWMWMPALLFTTLSALMWWTLYSKKSDIKAF